VSSVASDESLADAKPESSGGRVTSKGWWVSSCWRMGGHGGVAEGTVPGAAGAVVERAKLDKLIMLMCDVCCSQFTVRDGSSFGFCVACVPVSLCESMHGGRQIRQIQHATIHEFAGRGVFFAEGCQASEALQ
jgi:hypothetical protein